MLRFSFGQKSLKALQFSLGAVVGFFYLFLYVNPNITKSAEEKIDGLRGSFRLAYIDTVERASSKLNIVESRVGWPEKKSEPSSSPALQNSVDQSGQGQVSEETSKQLVGDISEEQVFSEEGTLLISVVDNFSDKEAVTVYELQKDDGAIIGLGQLSGIEAKPGNRIRINYPRARVSGPKSLSAQEYTLEITSTQSSNQEIQSVTGQQRVAVILANFSNLQISAPTKAEVQRMVDNKFEVLMNEMSFGQASFPSDVYGWVTMNQTMTCQPSEIYNAAIKAADSQINYSQYKYVAVFFPDNDCPYAGVSYFPPGPIFNTGEGNVSLLPFVMPDGIAIPYGDTIMAHEIGHSMGLVHANGWDCGPTTLGSNCENVEYGDYFDLMGGAWDEIGHYGALYKEFLGWIPGSKVQVVNSSGIYSLYPEDVFSPGIQSLKIMRAGTNTYYNAESRIHSGYDQTLPSIAKEGVLLKIIPQTIPGFSLCCDVPYGTNNTKIIDPYPESGEPEFLDAGWTIGNTFVDPERGLMITPISKQNGILNLEVKFYPPTIINPGDGAALTDKKLDWENINYAESYTVQVSANSNFSSLLVNKSTNSSEYVITENLPTNITLYWRVRANYNFGTSLWSTQRSMIVPVFSDLSAELQENSAVFHFSYPLAGSFVVEMANTSNFSTGIYRYFGLGNNSPIVVSDPIKWDQYRCGNTLWWRVISNENVTSPIQTGFIQCANLIPTPISPANNSYVNPREVLFDWNDVQKASFYDVQVDIRDDFYSTNLFVNKRVNASSYLSDYEFQGATKFYWRVRAGYAGGISDWSAPNMFTTAFRPVNPVNIAPGNGSTATKNPPLLEWGNPGSPAGISKVMLQLSSVSTMNNLIINEELPGTSNTYQLSGELTPGQYYYWRVKVIDGIGQETNWSDITSFTVSSNPTNIKTVTYSIEKSEDDTNYNCYPENAFTSISLIVGPQLACKDHPRHNVLMMFRNVQIPKNAGVEEARLELVSDGNYTNSLVTMMSMTFGGQYSYGTGSWTINSEWKKNSLVSSINFAKTFEAMLADKSWMPGWNVQIYLMYQDDSGSDIRSFKSFDAGASVAPKLIIRYLEPEL